MIVTVNGEKRSLDGVSSVDDLITRETKSWVHRGLAVAVNGEVVPRSSWKDTQLAEGDKIELLNAIGGG